jgi:hypothetical protein
MSKPSSRIGAVFRMCKDTRCTRAGVVEGEPRGEREEGGKPTRWTRVSSSASPPADRSVRSPVFSHHAHGTQTEHRLSSTLLRPASSARASVSPLAPSLPCPRRLRPPSRRMSTTTRCAPSAPTLARTALSRTHRPRTSHHPSPCRRRTSHLRPAPRACVACSTRTTPRTTRIDSRSSGTHFS